MAISLVLALVFYIMMWHWLSDFVFQSDWMAKQKSSSNKILAMHVAMYMLIMLSGTIILGFGTPVVAHSLTNVLLFVLVNGAAHFVTDYVTSRWTSRLYKAGRTHDFFIVIGLDQLAHTGALLVTTFYFLIG